MSLLDEFVEDYSIMEKVRTPDGEGGFVTDWHEGAIIKMAAQFDNTLAARIAEKDGVKSVYTFIAHKGCPLAFHDVVKRLSDGAYFRITSHSNERVTPESASFDLTALTAERWQLT